MIIIPIGHLNIDSQENLSSARADSKMIVIKLDLVKGGMFSSTTWLQYQQIQSHLNKIQ